MSRSTLLAGIPIVALCLATTAALVDRERAPRSFDGGASDLSSPTDTWLGLYAGEPSVGNKVGYARIEQFLERREDADGATVRLTLALNSRILGRDTDLRIAGWGWKALLDERARFDFRVEAGGSPIGIAGGVENGRLRAQVDTAGESLPLDLPVPGDLSFGSGLGGVLTLPALEVGSAVRLAAFDPLQLDVAPVLVRCTGYETLALPTGPVRARVLEVEASGLTTRVWVDDDGEVLQAVTPLGLSLVRLPPEQALAPAGTRAGDDLLERTAVRPAGHRPFRGAHRMVVRLSGTPAVDGLPVDSAQQRLELSRPATAGARYQVEADGDERSAAEPAADMLAADPFVQADHPRIRARAAEILTGVADDPADRAAALYDWVYRSIEKTPVMGIPSALEVLDSLRGDCNEHTVLYAALARSAGLPTNIAIGVVWSDDLDGFYYHAWPEVWWSGSWHRIDPTLGQSTADATHLKLLEGGIERWPQLLPFLGHLAIEVEQIE